MNKIIRWGIVGCGDVTEKKSGPALYKSPNSQLVAVMRRNRDLAEDFARRHNVKHFTDNATQLITNPDLDAVYIATPPSSHCQYAIEAMQAGKAVYVEKPMARSYNECRAMAEISERTGQPLFVAYYRRALPYFVKVKEIVESGILGRITDVSLRFTRPPSPCDMESPLPWRLQKEHSAGGYIQDMGSHQIDILIYLLGRIKDMEAYCSNVAGLYPLEDTIKALLRFESGVTGSATWCFVSNNAQSEDSVTISGLDGLVRFSVFGMGVIELHTKQGDQRLEIATPEHIQQPFITMINDWLRRGESKKDWLEDAILTTRLLERLVL